MGFFLVFFVLLNMFNMQLCVSVINLPIVLHHTTGHYATVSLIILLHNIPAAVLIQRFHVLLAAPLHSPWRSPSPSQHILLALAP